MLGPVSLQQVLEVVAEFDRCGGASLGLVAWEVCVDEHLVAHAWRQAINDGLIRPAGRDWHGMNSCGGSVPLGDGVQRPSCVTGEADLTRTGCHLGTVWHG
jgi:hypothetical protein